VKSTQARTFVGFGFGPIQLALFLYEAQQSGCFDRYVAADIDRELVAAVRENRGRCRLNIARFDRVDRASVEGVELLDPRDPEDARRLREAIAASSEMCTALPSVEAYAVGGESSVAGLLSGGLVDRAGSPGRGLRTLIYTAENHNRAAEILTRHLEPLVPPAVLRNVQILNTVIGKMSALITEPQTIETLELATITPRLARAVLVEEFNRILVSKVRLPGCRPAIEVFLEKEELLPFEEAKLYGHNAIHALIAYLADLKGYRLMAEAGKDRWIMETARKAFIEESGAALIRRHAGVADPLFTEKGYRQHAEELLQRMVNPYLNDLVERVGRDRRRKLAIEDRLYGTMVIALQEDIEPKLLALGAAAAVLSLLKNRDMPAGPIESLPEAERFLDRTALERLLRQIWGAGPVVERYGEMLISLTWKGIQALRKAGHCG
jgi:hypothetical protein